MTRSETTKFLGELLISTRFVGAGKHWASEVSIDPMDEKQKELIICNFPRQISALYLG